MSTGIGKLGLSGGTAGANRIMAQDIVMTKKNGRGLARNKK
jgi:hypothetical protein